MATGPRYGWLSMLLWPVTVPAGFLGLIYFAIFRRRPPSWVLTIFGLIVAAALVWAISSLAMKAS